MILIPNDFCIKNYNFDPYNVLLATGYFDNFFGYLIFDDAWNKTSLI